MSEKRLLSLVEEYQSRFGHRIPNWAGKTGTAEEIETALLKGAPVTAWRDYRPNPQNFFALADSLKREAAAAAALAESKDDISARTATQSAKMLVPKFSCHTAGGWHIQWPKDDPHVVYAASQDELIPLLADWLRELGRVGNKGSHVAAENACPTCR